MLDDKIAAEILETRDRMLEAGELPAEEQLARYYALIRERFGPEQLRQLDGEALLRTMHEHGNYDSLVYWLEFKDDQEFPAHFGSIAGGSALKFGIYRRRETGLWMTGSVQAQQVLTIDQAVAIARRHRDQLVRGTQLLDELPANANDQAYRDLQESMARECPDVQDTAWGHKYFSLHAPGKLDDYHNPDYQRFHLIRLLQLPPTGAGRYLCAGRYVALGRQLAIPLNHLTSVLNEDVNRPYRYWRIGTSDGVTSQNRWKPMLDGSFVAIGWPELGNLSDVEYSSESKAELRSRVERLYSSTPQPVGNIVSQIFNFAAGIGIGDLVVAADGATLLAVGRVTGAYSWNPEGAPDIPHRRAVEWLHVGDFTFSSNEGLRTSVFELRKQPENLIEIERRRLFPTPPIKKVEDQPEPGPLQDSPSPIMTKTKLTGIAGRIQSILERKGQVILYGPPGTGKTHWAEIAAHDLASISRFGALFPELTSDEQHEIVGEGGLVRLCSFHPAYGYEDFLEGFRPQSSNSQMQFVLRDGIFKRICADAQTHPHHRYYLIIDEINRGDIPRIFGELLTVLEITKRGRSILLPLSGTPFAVPANLFLIGTMNTADRSIALLDTALRRRFGFIELMPDNTALGEVLAGNIPLGPWLEALNARIREHLGRDARNLQIGHSYLMSGSKPISDFANLARAIQDDIIPLLEEYCYESYDALEKILGPGLVDRTHQRIRHDLFEPTNEANLIQALLAPNPEIATSHQAISALATSDVAASEDEDEPESTES